MTPKTNEADPPLLTIAARQITIEESLRNERIHELMLNLPEFEQGLDMAEQKHDRVTNIPGQLPINQETLDILVANIIPTSKYFEARFDHMEGRVDRMQNDIIDFRSDVDKRFGQVDKRFDELKSDVDKCFDELRSDIDKRFDGLKSDVDKRFVGVNQRFEQVDKRFEQVDKRFEQVDKRFEQMIKSIDKLSEKQDRGFEKLLEKLDHRDERQRNFTLRMFTISITISILGVTGAFLKSLGLI